jgi:hypothetical protein
MTEGITSFVMFEEKGLPCGQIQTCVSSGFISQFSMHNLIKFNHDFSMAPAPAQGEFE